MMNTVNKYLSFPVLLAMAIALSFNATAFAQDDGARAYWNARAGTRVVSFQYLPIGISASGSNAFAPGQFIYPNSDIEANIFIGTFAYHMTLLNRPSALAVNVLGGNVGVNVNTSMSPDSLPPITTGAAFSQSSSGFADPNMQLVVNLFGTPTLKSTVDLLNYEPTVSLDAAVLLAFPIGEYENDKLVNLGLNRAENDDFLGQKLENDPLWSLEAHLTHDFAAGFFGSLDLLYQNGFQSTIDGNDVGENLEIGNLGFALNYQVTDNVTTRAGFSSNVFGDDNLETSVIRLQFVYAWNPVSENAKKLQGH
jgi:hypothetical protein